MDRTLRADFFSDQPAEPRTTVIPDDRQVAIQVPYGTVEDCDTRRPVEASFAFTYTTDTDANHRRGSIVIGGTEMLDDIRAKRCTTQVFHNQTASSLDDVVVTNGTVMTQLTITKTDGPAVIVIGDASGTILVAVRTDDDHQRATLTQRPVTRRCRPDPPALTCCPASSIDMTLADNRPAPLRSDHP